MPKTRNKDFYFYHYLVAELDIKWGLKCTNNVKSGLCVLDLVNSYEYNVKH